MFWDNFVNLCVSNNTKPNPVAKELGISSGAVTKWKSGTTPNSITMKKIADYFGVSKDYFLIDRTKKNDTLSDIILKIRANKELFELVLELQDLSSTELKFVASVVSTIRERSDLNNN